MFKFRNHKNQNMISKSRNSNNQNMSAMFQNKDKEYYVDFISKVALPSFQKGNFEYISVLQRVFALEDAKDYQLAVADAYIKLLSQSTVKQLIYIEDHCRRYPAFDEWNASFMWKPHWESVDMSRALFRQLSDEQYQAVLKLGTFHANGYCRQICITELSAYEDSLPFFIFRMNDWVEAIREKAFQFSCNRIKTCSMHELVSAMPMLDKLRNSGRRKAEYLNQIEQLIYDHIASKAQTMEIDRVHAYDVTIKNAIYRFVNRYPVLSLDAMETLLFHEKQSYGKKMMILGIFKQYDCDSETMETYLKSKSSVVRYETLVYRYYTKAKEPWTSLTDLLMDKTMKIRLEASYILEKHKVLNALEYYKNKLTESVSAIAIHGIGEHGSYSDIELIKPYLEHQDERLVKAAFSAYCNLMADKGGEIYWKYLLDKTPGICKRAFMAIRKYAIHYGAEFLYSEYLRQENKQIKNYILKLICIEPSTWGRLPYLLKLLCDDSISEDQENLIRSTIAKRSMWAHISQNEAHEIRDILEEVSKIKPYITKTDYYTGESLRGRIEFELKFVAREE